MNKLFVRERILVGEGTGVPRFAVVAALGTDLRVFARHFRKVELEKLAEETGAEIVYLPRGEHTGEKEGKGEQNVEHGMGRGMRRRHAGQDGVNQE
jgi:hypothetical protein